MQPPIEDDPLYQTEDRHPVYQWQQQQQQYPSESRGQPPWPHADDHGSAHDHMYRHHDDHMQYRHDEGGQYHYRGDVAADQRGWPHPPAASTHADDDEDEEYDHNGLRIENGVSICHPNGPTPLMGDDLMGGHTASKVSDYLSDHPPQPDSGGLHDGDLAPYTMCSADAYDPDDNIYNIDIDPPLPPDDSPPPLPDDQPPLPPTTTMLDDPPPPLPDDPPPLPEDVQHMPPCPLQSMVYSTPQIVHMHQQYSTPIAQVMPQPGGLPSMPTMSPAPQILQPPTTHQQYTTARMPLGMGQDLGIAQHPQVQGRPYLGLQTREYVNLPPQHSMGQQHNASVNEMHPPGPPHQHGQQQYTFYSDGMGPPRMMQQQQHMHNPDTRLVDPPIRYYPPQQHQQW